uniref:14 kDa phosphohistidine phosphatase n=1 Tax=Cacopsylla melanoneura TaxID=428564 RepID=A0A8D9ALJ7_9HEMI
MIKLLAYSLAISICLQLLQIEITSTEINSNKQCKHNNTFDSILTVDIDSRGRFKYILIKLEDKESGRVKYLVHGNSMSFYHSEILDKFLNTLTNKNLKVTCVGGGRIVHNPDTKSIEVFGTSYAYGRADHNITKQILAKKYMDYNIKWSNDGY